MTFISFSNFDIRPGRIDFHCEQQGRPEPKDQMDLYFEFNRNDVIPSNDAIAYACATMAGCSYERFILELPISRKAWKYIAEFTKSQITIPIDEACMGLDLSYNENVMLNFSGGYDSLAAMCLMPKDIALVAIDFGGWFEREAEYFQRFNPYILKTNFRQEKLDRASWTFMGCGVLLFAEYLKAGTYVSGTILEATKQHFLTEPPIVRAPSQYRFLYTGLKSICYTHGLSEVGTAIVVTHYLADQVEASLASLSKPKTEKRYRKETLTDIVAKKFGRSISFPHTQPPEQKIAFSTNLALDFLCLYIIKNAGLKKAMDTVYDIPSEALQLTEMLTLNFYERLNTTFIGSNAFPDDKTRNSYMEKVLACGVIPYTEDDFQEFRTVVDFLNQYHHIYP